MKNCGWILLVSAIFLAGACKKNSVSVNFKNLTSVTWQSDSMLADGVISDGPGQMLEKFKGEARFSPDGTGLFGKYNGTWRFAENEKDLVIESDSLLMPLTASIVLLTSTDFKITTSYPNPMSPLTPFKIRMTFKAK